MVTEEETFNEEFHQLRQLEISLLREYAPATGLTGEEVDVARHASRQAVIDRLRPHAERYFAPLIELEKLLLRHFADVLNFGQKMVDLWSPAAHFRVRKHIEKYP